MLFCTHQAQHYRSKVVKDSIVVHAHQVDIQYHGSDPCFSLLFIIRQILFKDVLRKYKSFFQQSFLAKGCWKTAFVTRLYNLCDER